MGGKMSSDHAGLQGKNGHLGGFSAQGRELVIGSPACGQGDDFQRIAGMHGRGGEIARQDGLAIQLHDHGVPPEPQ